MTALGASYGLLTQSLGLPSGLAGWQVLQKRPITSFAQFTSDPVLKKQIAYFKANIGSATTADKLLSDPNLANVALTAYGLSAQIGYNGLMSKVLNSNPADTSSMAYKLVSQSYRQIAAGFGYGTPAVAATPAVASQASVAVNGLAADNGFSSFSGTFGGLTVSQVDVSGATDLAGLADTLTQAFQKADGNRADITVSASNGNLVFNDAKGRGTATSFAWTTPGSESAPPSAAAPGATVAGQQGVAASGGAAIAASAALASTATVALGNLTGSNGFASFSGAFGDVALHGVDLSGAHDAAGIAATLTQAFQQADGGGTAITVSADANGNLVFNDAQGRGTAAGFQWNAVAGDTNPPTAAYAPDTQAGSQAHASADLQSWIGATPSSAEVALGGSLNLFNTFGTFSGTFGGVSLSGVNLSGSYNASQVATKLTSAFQAADGGANSITVTVGQDGNLLFQDSQGRGTASGFDWTASAGDSNPPTAALAPALVAGQPAVPASGGPNVGSASFVQSVIDKYTQAMFDQTVGNDSSELGNALYAQQKLPGITSWYSVIADTKLAGVVEGALNLPTSFQKLDVDTQVRMLGQRMNIADFQNPAKLNTMLTKYVAISTAQDTSSSASTSNNPALAILSGVTSSFSSDSMTALLTST